MNKLSYNGLKVDLEIRKKLTELIQLKDDLEKNNNLSPLEEQQNKLALQKVNELIGQIRYNALDKLGIFSKEENKIEKDFPGMAEGEQRHSQYEDLQVGKQPKIGDTQKPIEITKGAFGPDSPKISVEQSESENNYDEANKGGEHVGNVFQLSSNSSRLSETNENPLDFNPSASQGIQDEQELTAGEIRLLDAINDYLTKLEKD